MTLDEKIDIYQQLLNSLNKGVFIAAQLYEKGFAQEADKQVAVNQKLANAAANIRRKIMAQWSGQAPQIVADIRKLNARLQEQIRDIERDIKISERAAKALEYVDDAVKVAVKLLM